MANPIGVLPWQNDNALIAYPFVSDFGFSNFIIDAQFVQFDGFVPILNSIQITDVAMILNITFDTGAQAVTMSHETYYTPNSQIEFYDGTRYLGQMVFGSGLQVIWDGYINQTITPNTNFIATIVRAIPSNSGVYKLNGLTGAVNFHPDSNIFFNISGNNVTCNAVALPEALDVKVLKTINGVTPVANNIFIQDTTLLKITSSSANTLQFALIGGNLSDVLTNIQTAIPTI